MPALKLGPIETDKPVKLTIELPASVHRDLTAYAEVHAQQMGQAPLVPARIVPAILERFMETDRVFKKLRRTARAAPKQSPA